MGDKRTGVRKWSRAVSCVQLLAVFLALLMVVSLPASAALAGDWGSAETGEGGGVALDEMPSGSSGPGFAEEGPPAATRDDSATDANAGAPDTAASRSIDAERVAGTASSPVMVREATQKRSGQTQALTAGASPVADTAASDDPTAQSAEFELSNLSQPVTLGLDESPFSEVEVTNVGSSTGQTEVLFVIDIGGETIPTPTAETVELGPGESTTVADSVTPSFAEMNLIFGADYQPGDDVPTGFQAGENLSESNPDVEDELAANISILNGTVTDWDELDSLRDNRNGTYELANDLNASTEGYAEHVAGGWSPIGNDTEPFSGTLDGNGSVISDFVVDTDASNAGLFGVLDGRVADIELDDVSVTGTETVGTVAGSNTGTVTDVNVSGDVTGDSGGAQVAAGGLVGENEGTVKSSQATATVSGTAANSQVFVGGLVGENNGTVRTSSASGDVTGVSGTIAHVGGAVGENTDTVEEVLATGEVSGTADLVVNVGGLAADNDATSGSGIIMSSYARNDVTASGDGAHNAGGLVGINTGLISGSYAAGQVGGTDNTGLFVGDHDEGAGEIADSYVQLPPGPATLPPVNGIENDTENASVENLTALPAGQMTGPGTTATMPGLNFGSTWQVPTTATVPDRSFYPELQSLSRDPDPIHVEPYRPAPTPEQLVADPTVEIPGPPGLPVDQPADSYEVHWYLNGAQFNTTPLTAGGAETALTFGTSTAGDRQELTAEVRDDSGTVVTELNRTFAVAPSIVGTVRDGAGNPVGDVDMKVYDAADPIEAIPIRNATTDFDGAYSVASTPVSLSGQVQVFADPPDDGPLTAVTSDPFEPAGVDRVPIELDGPVEQLRGVVEELENESRDLIDEHTQKTAEVYVDGYQAFDEGGDLHKPSFKLTDTADLLDAVSETLRDSPSRKDIALSLAGFFKSLATGPSDNPLVNYHTERYSNAPALRDEQLERISEMANEDWFENTEYTGSPDQAYEEGFTETAIYDDAHDRLNDSSEQFDNLTEMDVSEIPEAFSDNIDDIEYILERQLDELAGDQSYVITPNGSAVRFEESSFERMNYERAAELARSSSSSGNTFGFIGLVASGATLLLLAVGTGGVALVALGLVSTVTGVGETLATVGKLSAIPRVVMHWKDSITFWVADLEEIPRIHQDNINWIEDQIENPTLHEVEGTVEETTVRAQSYDDSSVDDPETIEQINPQPVLACHIGPTYDSKWSDRVHEVTVTNTGETTATVHVVTEVRRVEINGDEAVDISESVSGVTDPVTLAPGETRTIESSFTAYKETQTQSFEYNWLVASTVLMDGKIVGAGGNIVKIIENPGLVGDIYECQGSDSGAAVTGETTASHDAFAEHSANTTVLAETDLTPDERSIEQTVEMADDTERVTISLDQQPRSNVTLAVVGPDDNVTGVTQSGAALSSVEQIPNSTYSGPRDGIEGGESVTIESPPENLTVRAEGRWFLSNGSFSTQVRMTEVPERPGLVDVGTASDPGLQVPARVGDTTEQPIEITEIGGQSGAEVSLSVSETQLPDGIDVTLNETALSLAPGENDTVGLQTETTAGVEPGVYPVSVNATGSGVETSALTLPVVTVDEASGLSVESLQRVTSGLQFESVGGAVGTTPAGYQLVRGYNITGSSAGEADVLVENIETDNGSVPFTVSDGEWESLGEASNPETIRRTVPVAADGLAVLEPVVDQPALGTVSGVVTDANGTTATDVEVRFLEPGADTPLVTAVTDADGQYEATIPPGTYDVVVTDPAYGTFEGQAEVERGTGTAFDITLADALVPLPGFENPPGDLNGDGLHEDVDGDGAFDIFDVQALFTHLDSEPVQEQPVALNFNNDTNPDGVTIFDVQGLFNRLEAQE